MQSCSSDSPSCPRILPYKYELPDLAQSETQRCHYDSAEPSLSGAPESQYDAPASQRYTWPAITGFEPALTVAVAVTSVPCVTDVTALPLAVNASVVEAATAPLITVTTSGVELVTEHEVPVIVDEVLPLHAVLSAVRVSVLFVVVVAGENVAVTPVGRPVAERFTPFAKPFTDTTLTVDLPEVPDATKTLLGAATNEKPPMFTITCAVVELVILPDVPDVMVNVVVPGDAVLAAESVIVLVPVAGFGENDAVTPLGSPEAVRLTLPVKPYCGLTLTELVALAPWFRLVL